MQHGQDAQGGLHVAAALLQDVVHSCRTGRAAVGAAVQDAHSGVSTCAARGELLSFNHRRSGHLIQTI